MFTVMRKSCYLGAREDLSLPRPLRPLVTVVGGRDGCVRSVCDNWASHLCINDEEGG
jgi:hypothetical protein